MKKKGLSNIEFILAFVLFAAFVVAAIYLFNPVKSTKLLESSKNYVVGQITGELSTSVDYYSVKLETGGSCSGSVIEVVVPQIAGDSNARVEDYYGNVMPSRKSGAEVIFDRGNENFAIIRFSKELETGTFGEASEVSNPSCYQIASSYPSTAISEKRALEFNESYNRDYEELRKQMDIPANINFGFVLRFDDGRIIFSDKETPLKVEVFSETKRVEILKTDGSSEFGQFTIRTW